jgi:lysophospholipase L1-like esterase
VGARRQLRLRLGVRIFVRRRSGLSRIVVAALGDSITAGSPLWDPDPRVQKRIGAALDERSQWEYWAAHRDPRLEFRNRGVYGERTDQVARRLDECASGAGVLVVQGGINDIAQRRSVERGADNLRRMVRRGKELDLSVLLADVLPWNNGSPAADGPIRRLNELIAALAREEEVPLLPFHDALKDPERPGLMRGEWTSDGDHPSIEGYRRLGEWAFRLPD